MKRYIKASELSGDKLNKYIDFVEREVENNLDKDVESVSIDVDDDFVSLHVKFIGDFVS